MFHEEPKVGGLRTGVDDQVYVVGHQTVGIHLQRERFSQLTQAVQIRRAILIGDKDDPTVVSPLNDMVWIVGDGDSASSRHPAAPDPVCEQDMETRDGSAEQKAA